MILVIALLALAAWATVATFVELRRDGYRRAPTDWSRVPDAPRLRSSHERALATTCSAVRAAEPR